MPTLIQCKRREAIFRNEPCRGFDIPAQFGSGIFMRVAKTIVEFDKAEGRAAPRTRDPWLVPAWTAGAVACEAFQIARRGRGLIPDPLKGSRRGSGSKGKTHV
jgi:hypothetical protein